MGNMISTRKTWETVVGNTDLLQEILLRLPAKSLLKFKCVSKQWFFLISDPRFCHSRTIHHHTPHSVPSALLLSAGYASSPHFQVVPLKLKDSEQDPSSSSPSSSAWTVQIPVLDYLDASEVRILQSCNGLLLCSSGFTSDCDDHYRYFICNPTTKQFVTLPCLPKHISKGSLSGKTALTVAFDPLISPNFKVLSIRFTFGIPEAKLRIYIYSSETDSWHDTGIALTDFDGMGRPGVYCKGMVHWCGHLENNWSLDVESESLRRLPMPWSVDQRADHRAIGYFGESRGHLYMVVNPTNSEFDILEMVDDYSGWSIKYHVDLDLMEIAIPEIRWSWINSRVCIIREEEEQDPRVLFCLDGQAALVYDHKNQTFRKLSDLELCSKRGRVGSFQLEVFQYFESLSYLTTSSVYHYSSSS